MNCCRTVILSVRTAHIALLSFTAFAQDTSNGCDVLVHDAQMLELYAKIPERLHSFVTKYHTTTEQLAALATEAKAELLVLYHTVAFRPGIAPPKFLSSLTGAGAFRSTPEVLQERGRLADSSLSGKISTCIRFRIQWH